MPVLYQEGIRQTAYTEITTSTTTTSTTYVDLLSLTITTGANSVIAHFSASNANSADTQWTEFQLVLDGTPLRGIAYESVSSGNGDSGSIVYKTSVLTAGSHTFTIQWHIGPFSGGNANLDPSSSIGHASFYLEEVTV